MCHFFRAQNFNSQAKNQMVKHHFDIRAKVILFAADTRTDANGELKRQI